MNLLTTNVNKSFKFSLTKFKLTKISKISFTYSNSGSLPVQLAFLYSNTWISYTTTFSKSTIEFKSSTSNSPVIVSPKNVKSKSFSLANFNA